MALNRSESLFYFAPGNSPRLLMFTKFPDRYVAPSFESDRFSIRRVALPAREEILLALVHFPSKLYWSEDSQMLECTVLAATIVDQERRAGHSRTVMIGDLNVNPFEKGVVGASGLHATMARTVAERASRVVQGNPYPFFYNPMWGHLWDWLERPSGSFYYERAEQVMFFWNIFDQVLVRPALLDRFRSNDVRILNRVGKTSLAMPDGRPDGRTASDHFRFCSRLICRRIEDMPEETADFWPELNSAKVRTPLLILKEQAALLGKHTQNLVVASVDTQTSSADFVHRFIIEAPTLNYRYELFIISHDLLLYPVQVLSGPRGNFTLGMKFNSEEEFVKWLKDVLNSSQTKRILGSLIAQVEA
jgi:hypothetical protein